MSEELNGIQKAAILLIALNQEMAAKIFSLMEDDEIKEISLAMSSMGHVSPENIEKVVAEFNGEIKQSISFIGNIQNTERLLRKILSDDKVNSILEDIRGPSGKNIWDKLSNVSEEVLANYIKNEYPQTAALILSKIPSQQAANVLKILSPEFAFEVIKRILAMDPVKKEVLDKVEKTLRHEFISGVTKIQKNDFNQIMAEIFNNFDRITETKYMTLLEEHSAESADKIKKLMFTFNDIARIDNSGIQQILKVVDKAKLPIAMKGASEDLRKKFMDNMSQRAVKILQEEIEGLGPVRLKDVYEAQGALITIARDLIGRGEIKLSDGNDSDQLIY
ncbi:MAG: flagellar motor switch protein FliG [Candidatus Jidaibacter sp.]|jgi:flagellar motor switch protein FliG|nr:flagellar motor switch protein FliG [Candidatus Jidaibacter sp.]